MHGNELGDLVLRHTHPVVTEIEGVIDLRRADVYVHPFHIMIRWIVDGVRGSHAVWRSRRAFKQRGATIDGEFRLAIQDHEHLFAVIVKMLAYTGMGMKDTAVKEEQVGRQGLVRH